MSKLEGDRKRERETERETRRIFATLSTLLFKSHSPPLSYTYLNKRYSKIDQH